MTLALSLGLSFLCLWFPRVRVHGLVILSCLLVSFWYLSYDELTPWMVTLDFGILSVDLYPDDMSLWFIILTGICCCWIILSSSLKGSLSVQLQVLVAYMFVCSILLFMSGNLLVIYFAFEMVTIPILLYVGTMGLSSRRSYALSVMVIYMLGSSGLMATVLFMYMDEFLGNQFIGSAISHTNLSGDSWIITTIILVFFGVKVPVFPFYIWLPEAHVESNTEMSILLASIILKFGVFSLLRVGYWIDSSYINCATYIYVSICLIGLIHSSLSSIQHLDLKKLIAYSSIVHMQLGLVCIFSNDYCGMYVLMLGLLIHGIVSIGLFYTIGVASESIGTRHIAFIHAGTSLTPVLSLLGFITVLLNISAPLSLGSLVEFLTLSVFNQFGGLTLFIGSICAIWFCTLFSLILLYRAFMNDSGWFNNDTSDLSIMDSFALLSMYLLLVFSIILV